MTELSDTHLYDNQLRIIIATLGLILLSRISENLNENVDLQNNAENRPLLDRCICYLCPIL